MAYIVLARKYRPSNFSELVGQSHVVQALTNALTSQRLHHAYLFTGTRGVGKTTVSRILAKSLNCTGVDGQGGVTAQPCGCCASCVDIDAGRFVDYTELDAASNRGVDEIQQLLEQAAYKPVQGRFKVFMIDEVHMLSNTAFNAMLKTLEEPPEYLKFVLATTDPQKVPVTVLSRCLQFNLRPMPPITIADHLAHVLGAEAVVFEPAALMHLGRAARGSMRDALSLTDQAIAYGQGQLLESTVRTMLGVADDQHVLQILDSLARADGAAVVAVVDAMRLHGHPAAACLDAMAAVLQRMAVWQLTDGGGDADASDAQAIADLAQAMPADETQLLYSLCLQGRAELSLAVDEYAGLVMVLLRLLAFKPQAWARSAPVVEKKSLKSAPDVPAAPGVPNAPGSQAARVDAAPAAGVSPIPLVAGPVVPDRPTPAAHVPEVVHGVESGVQRIAAQALEPLQALLEQGVRETSDRLDQVAVAPSVLAPPPLLEGDFWFGVVQDLVRRQAVSALARELALQSQMIARDDSIQPPHWLLRIERASLNQSVALERLRGALAEAGHAVQLGVELGRVSDTPGGRMAAQRQRRLQEAEAQLRQDPALVDAFATFGGTIVPGSLRLNDGG